MLVWLWLGQAKSIGVWNESRITRDQLEYISDSIQITVFSCSRWLEKTIPLKLFLGIVYNAKIPVEG